MKFLKCLVCMIFVVSAHATTYYVDRTRPDDSGNGLSWVSAKRTIQAAVNAAANNDTIIVGPGVYDEGSTATPSGTLPNRVVCTKNVSIESTDGAEMTIIKGAFDTTGSGDAYGRGPNAVRCVYMTEGALTGFTLTGGATAGENLENANNRGGGLYATVTSKPVVSDCIVSNNASHRGGGALFGTFHRTLFTANYASNNGSATRSSRLYDSLIVKNLGASAIAYVGDTNHIVNCTIADNAGKGLEQSAAANSIIVGNGSGDQGNCYLVNCLVDFTPRSGYNINNMFSSDARFTAPSLGNYRLLSDSLAIDAGNPALYGYTESPGLRTDFYGNPRIQGSELDLGAIEGAYTGTMVSASASGSGTISPQGYFELPVLPTQLVFNATAEAGHALRHFAVNGGKMKDCGNSFTLKINRPGSYNLEALFLPVRYVDTEGDDNASGTSPATAWRTLQYAVDNAPLGGMVLAAPGLYNEGHTYYADHTNRVSITRNVVLKSSSGADQTFIIGKRDPNGNEFGCGTNAMRCAYIASTATLEGFTLTGGASGVSINDVDTSAVRGGALIGEAFGPNGGQVWDCIVSNNVASRGAAAFRCGSLYRCLVTGNHASNNSTFRETFVYDSLIVKNSGNYAGSFSGVSMFNCTISGHNKYGLGQNSQAFNSIVYGNDTADINHVDVTCEFCCTGGSLCQGEGNILDDPLFVDAENGDYRLLAASPCVNAGSFAYGTGEYGTDFSGLPRWLKAKPHIGAYNNSLGAVIASSTSGGTISPSGNLMLNNDITFTATPWDGRSFRYFETNGVIVAGGDTNITITASENETAAIILRAVFQDGYYVDSENGNQANSGLEPDAPLKELQTAIDLASPGDTVRVSAGVYQSAGRPAEEGGLTNRVVINKNITVVALDGPSNTFITGARSNLYPDGCGPDAVRCVYISAGSIEGFTLTGGATDREDGNGLENDCGGGIYSMDTSSAQTVNCVISNNIAYFKGGGSSRAVIHRCLFDNNDVIAYNGFGAAVRGGSIFDSLMINQSSKSVVAWAYLYNSTVYSPSSIEHTTLRNCIAIRTTGASVYSYNSNRKAYNCCLTGNLSSENDGGGNIFTDPYFINAADGDFRLHSLSPCIDTGSANTYDGLGLDYAGMLRLQGAQIDMGAYEGGLGGLYVRSSVLGGGDITPAGLIYIESVPATQTFTATPWPGREFLYFTTNGVPLPNTGNSITFSTDTALLTTLTAHFAGTLYVDASRPDNSGDGTSWANAKRTLQATVDITADNDTVLVAPGIYNEGSALTPDEPGAYLYNRVAITNNITMRSRDGAENTIIQGASDPGSGDIYGRGPAALRCVYISKGILQGFTLTGGATDKENVEDGNNRGGGVYAPFKNFTPLILDCIITNNASVRGGGSFASTLKGCLVANNYATGNGSGIRDSYAYNCVIINNLPSEVIACYYARLYNCTVAGHPITLSDNSHFHNCILIDGQSRNSTHYDCCIRAETVGTSIMDNCFYDDPMFVNAATDDYRLMTDSPCIDRANHEYVDDLFGTDVSGDMRMQNAHVDVGAYEHDWRPTFAADLDAIGITVSDISPFVTHTENSSYIGGNAVYLDGAAAQTAGLDNVSITTPWYVFNGRTVSISFQVTGGGTLAIYEGETLIDEIMQQDGAVTQKYATSNQDPSPLRFVYTVAENETGGAILDAFENLGGMLLIIR